MPSPIVQDRFDSGSRYLIKLQPTELIAWRLRGGVAFRRWLDTRSIPFPGSPPRVCDTVCHAEESDGRPWAVVIECQTQPDPDMFGRLLSYLGQLSVERRPDAEAGSRFHVAAIVVNLSGRGSASRDDRMPRSKVRTCLRVDECNLAELNASAILRGIGNGKLPRSLLGWVPLMKNGAELATLRKWRHLADAETDPRLRADYGVLAELFSDLAGRRDVWRSVLEGWNMRESQVVLEWQAIAVTKTLRELLVDLLQDRFGSVPESLRRRIEAVSDAERLRAAIREVPRLGSLDELTI